MSEPTGGTTIIGLKTLRPVLATRSGYCPLCGGYTAKNHSWIVSMPEPIEPPRHVTSMRAMRGRYGGLRWVHMQCAKEYWTELGYRVVVPQTAEDRAELKEIDRGERGVCSDY